MDCWNLEPDMITILIGTNDVWHEVMRSNGVEKDRFERFYDMLIEDTRKALPNVKISVMGAFLQKKEREMKEKESIRLSDHFNYNRMLRFVTPSIMMMVFISIYSIVDGFFVSNFVSKTAFAAVNLMMPLLMILGAFGFMIGTGGVAIVAKTLGMGDKRLANRYFSFLVYVTVAVGVALSVLGITLAEPISVLLGAEGQMLADCVTYSRFVLLGLPFFMLQNVFQSFFITAEKPKLGLLVIVVAGVTNMVLDALLVGVFSFGLVGAALATAISQLLGGVIPLIYFALNKTGILKLGKTTFYGSMLLHTCVNGSSELMSNISESVVTILYNYQLMRYEGENGVAAYGAIMYVSFIFAAIFIGFSMGISPVISFNFGANNKDELKNLFRRSITVIGITSVIMTALSLFLSSPLSELFVGYDRELYGITVRGFVIFSFAFLTMGLNIFSSALFTALNNGVVSAVISFLRTLVFKTVAVLLLPLLLGFDGIWFSIIVGEIASFTVSAICVFKYRKKYGYA